MGENWMRRKNVFNLLIAFLALAVGAILVPSLANAGTSEELVRLQRDVQALQSQFREFDKTMTENVDGLKSLVTQLNDQIAKTSVLLNKISTTVETQASGGRTNDQELLKEVRALSIKIDDFSTRISALSQQVSDLKVQSQAMNQPPAVAAAPEFSPDTVYRAAHNDLVAANFDLAIKGFTNYLKDFPTENMAPAAQQGIGEAYFRQNKWPQAIAAFTQVITQYPNSDVVATALYKRGKAEIPLMEKENAIEDFRSVIKLYPDSAEANLAKQSLQELGAPITPAAPAKQPTRKKR
jgi:tol-pal system protein YbgF